MAVHTSVGVLLLCTALIVYFFQNRYNYATSFFKEIKERNYFIALLIVFVGCYISFLMLQSFLLQSYSLAREEFEQKAHSFFHSLEAEIQNKQKELLSIYALFSSSSYVSEEEFINFVRASIPSKEEVTLVWVALPDEFSLEHQAVILPSYKLVSKGESQENPTILDLDLLKELVGSAFSKKRIVYKVHNLDGESYIAIAVPFWGEGVNRGQKGVLVSLFSITSIMHVSGHDMLDSELLNKVDISISYNGQNFLLHSASQAQLPLPAFVRFFINDNIEPIVFQHSMPEISSSFHTFIKSREVGIFYKLDVQKILLPIMLFLMAVMVSVYIAMLTRQKAMLKEEKETVKTKQKILNAIITNLPVSFMAKNVQDDYKYMFWNNKAEEMFEKTQEAVNGKNDFDLYEAHIAGQIRQEDMEVFEQEKAVAVRQKEINISTETLTVKEIKVPVYDKNGQPSLLLVMHLDITEHIQVEKRILEAKEKAEAASAAKTSFLANMSHELRTPLNSILGMSELLDVSHFDSEQKEVLQILRYASKNLREIVDDILDPDSVRFWSYCPLVWNFTPPIVTVFLSDR